MFVKFIPTNLSVKSQEMRPKKLKKKMVQRCKCCNFISYSYHNCMLASSIVSAVSWSVANNGVLFYKNERGTMFQFILRAKNTASFVISFNSTNTTTINNNVSIHFFLSFGMLSSQSTA